MNRTAGIAGRLLACITAAALIVTALPSYALAAETDLTQNVVSELETVTPENGEASYDITSDDAGTGTDDVDEGEDTEDPIEEPGDDDGADGDGQTAEEDEEEASEADETGDELLDAHDEEDDDELLGEGDHSAYQITVNANAGNDADSFTYDFGAEGCRGLAEDEGTWYFALDGGETVSSFSFRIEPAEGYYIRSVEETVTGDGMRLTAKINGDFWTFEYIRLESGVSTPAPIDCDITLTVETEKMKTVTFTGGINEKYTVTISGDTSPLSSDTYSVRPGSGLLFTVGPKPGKNYRIDSVMVGDREVGTDLTGRYVLPPVTEDIEVRVETRGGPTDILCNFDTSIFKLTTAGTTGKWMDDQDPLMTAGKAVNVTIGKVASTTDLNSYDFTATYSYGSISPKSAPITDLKFTVPLEDVAAAENAQTELTIRIVASKKRIHVSAAGGCHAEFRYYDPQNNTSKSIEVSSDYGEETYVIATAEVNYKVTGVKAGTTGLRAIKKQIVIGENVYDSYYVLPASVMKKDIVLTAVTDPLPMQNASTVYIDKHDVTVTPTTRGVVSNAEGTVWTVPAGTKSLTYTVETTGSYLASASIGNGGSSTEVHMPVPEVNRTKRSLVYKISGAAADYAGNTLRVGGGEYQRKVMIKPAEDHIDPASLSVREDGRNVPAEESEDPITHAVTYIYRINDPFATVIVSGSPANGYKLSGKAVINGQETKLQNGSLSFTTALCDGYANSNVSIGTEPALAVKVKIGGTETVYSGNVKLADLPRNKIPQIELLKGGQLAVTKSDVTVAPVTPGFAVVSQNKILIYPTKVPDAKERKVTIKIPDPSDSKKTITVSLSFTFAQPIVNVKITGEKTGTDKKPFISQVRGTSAEYAVTLDKGCRINDLSAEAEDGVNAEAEIDETKKKLIVRTFKGGSVAEGTGFKIYLRDNANGADVKTLNVALTDPALKEPSVTVSQTSDIGTVLTLTAPKNAAFNNLYYMVTAIATSAGSGKMKTSLTKYAKASPGVPDICVLTLAKDVEGHPPVMGDGEEQEYSISVSLVMAQGDPEGGGSVLVSGRAKTLTKQRTKKPNTAKAEISLTGKSTTFIQGQKNVTAAVAKFSKDTSFTAVGTAYVEDEKGVKVTGAAVTSLSDGTVIIEDTSDIPVGKATLVVSPDCPGEVSSSPARLKLTVKAPIDKIEISPQTDKLYKQDQKAATLRLSAKTFWDNDDTDDGTWGKSSASKVTWSVNPVSDDSPLGGHISISTAGVVTIDKNYVLDPADDKNKFIVKAKAADFTGNTAEETMTVEVTNR